MKLPETLEAVTPEWLTHALGRHRPGIAVTSAAVVEVMGGTATKLRMAVDYDQAGRDAGLPPRLIVKGPFGKNTATMEHTFTDEMRAYAELVTDIGVNTPICYFAEKQGIVPVTILEDLALGDCVFGHAQRPLTFDQAASILDVLAILHARYWQHPELADDGRFGWVLRTVSGWHLDYMEMVLQPENWAFYMGLPRGAAVPRALASDPRRLRDALHRQWAFHRQGPLTLGHGDAHIANVYFNAKGGGVLDWEMRRCPWYHDVTYFLVSALDVVDRRRWESALLQHYLGRLKAHGVAAPDFDTALWCYRREILYGYVLFITNGDGVQYFTESANAAIAVRFAMAADDWDTLGAIDSDGPTRHHLEGATR